MKVAYNACFGGFDLSHKATMRYAELKGITLYAFVDVRTHDLDTKDRYRRASDEEAEGAFTVFYCTTPEYSSDTHWYKGRFDDERNDPHLIQVILRQAQD